MECLDQLNSNVVPTDRASTAALGRRCPACDNHNVLDSNTDNGCPTSPRLITSPTPRPIDCSCLPSPTSPNRPRHTGTSCQTMVTSSEPMSSSSSPSSSTVTSAKPMRESESEPTARLSPSQSELLFTHGSPPSTGLRVSSNSFAQPHSSQLRQSSITASSTPTCLNQDSNPVHKHSQSKPIPIQHSHRPRHHNDSDLTLGSLTPSAHHSVLFPKFSWGTGNNPAFGSSSPGNLSSLHFFNQQSPKYFKQPSAVTITPSFGGSRVPIPDTTPQVFDQWPRALSGRKTQHSGDTSTESATASQGLPSRSSTSRKDRPSSRRRLSHHHSRWKSRLTSGDAGDVTMTPMDGSRSDPGYDCGITDPEDRSLPMELIHQLHDLEHHNEDLSAEVVFALQDKGFVIHEVLGKGISSVVRRVTEKTTGQDFAVKIIDISGETGDSDVVEQTKRDTGREIKILRLCGNHENIIELYDVFETSTFIFLVFEICRQGELFDYLTSVVCLSEKRTRIFMRQLLGAVQFIHENNIVHRDLKPENILLDDDLTIKLSDFGFATIVDKGQELTELCGTPGYLAPEVLAHSMYENVSGYGKEVDMWACGVIMFTLLCGAPPFWNRRQMLMLRAIMNADYSFNSPEWDDISEDPKNLIQKLLVVNPKERLTARECLAHPFFESKVQELKKFHARRKFRSGVFCIMFFHRLFHFYRHPPPIAMDTLSTNPYSIKFIRKVIDTCAFSMYRHWVKRVDNQNRAALFEHTLRQEWKQDDLSLKPL